MIKFYASNWQAHGMELWITGICKDRKTLKIVISDTYQHEFPSYWQFTIYKGKLSKVLKITKMLIEAGFMVREGTREEYFGKMDFRAFDKGKNKVTILHKSVKETKHDN